MEISLDFPCYFIYLLDKSLPYGHYFLISEIDARRLAGNSQEAGLADNLTNLLLPLKVPVLGAERALLSTTALLKNFKCGPQI